MAFPRNSLRAFLSYAKSSLKRSIEQSEKVTIVTGNDNASSDLDSLTSAIIYAYFRSLNPPKTAFTSLYIPLLNINSADISLRPEFIALFRHANLVASNIITRDDLPSFTEIKGILPPEKTRWILVDHNKLPTNLDSIYRDRVHGVIDHHAEENAVMEGTDPEPRTLEKAGSCTSLVVRQFGSLWDTISSSSRASSAGHAQSSDCTIDGSAISQKWDAQIAKFAMASILEDTANLSSESKTETVDRDMIAYLVTKIQKSPQDSRTWDRDQFYSEITTAKQDIDSLRLSDIWRKDYKDWTENETKLGMSTVVKRLSFMVDKARQESGGDGGNKDYAFDTQVQQHMSNSSIDIFAVMTVFTNEAGEFQRELFLQAKGPSVDAADRFAEMAVGELGLVKIDIDGIPRDVAQGTGADQMWRRVWWQKELGKSRKVVGPLIRKAMQ
ncbi:MAG: hypothetical protein Q9191_003119 [Dirinaria sp. TL-2023a]